MKKTQKNQHPGTRDMFFEHVRSRLIEGEFFELSEEVISEKMRPLYVAYEIAKYKHASQMREGGVRYFEHARDVAYVVLQEFDVPTIDEIIMALLHDTIEDTSLDYASIRNIFGEKIANGVITLTKRPLDSYLTSLERIRYWSTLDKREFLSRMEPILKERRTEDYFGHLDELEEPVLKVKFADRINNLRTLSSCTLDKIERKILETEKYFLPVAEKKNKIAHQIILKEIEELNGSHYFTRRS